jgi:predicted nucleotidyltransferase
VRELSDVDLIAEFDAGREYSLLDRVRLENRLADLLGVKVDLSPARTLKDGIRDILLVDYCLMHPFPNLGAVIAPFRQRNISS